MRNIILVSLALLALQLKITAQRNNDYPKNYAGVSAIFDGTHLSSTWGLEYERLLVAGKHLGASVRFDYIDRYQSGNTRFLWFDFRDDYKISVAQLWGTGYLFTSKRRKCSGFVLSTALGLTNCVMKNLDPNYNTGNSRYQNLSSAWELGMGVAFPLSNRTSFRLMFTSAFTNPVDEISSESTGLCLFGTKLSIGF